MAKNKAAVLSVLNITWRLLVICLAVAALVALVFEITEEPIAEGERSRKEEAIRVIFADAHSAEEAKGIESERINAVYTVKNEKGELIGHCVDYVGVSDYGGDVNMMIGIGVDGKVVGLQIISHAETFIDRYTDENGCYTGIGKPYGTDVSAGATMSYRAIRDAITEMERLFAHDGEKPEEQPSAGEDTSAGEGEETPVPLFTESDVSQFFGNGIAFLELNGISDRNVIAACVVAGGDDAFLGHCVKYRAEGGHNGHFDLLMARSAGGQVIGVQVLAHFEQSMDLYVDQNNRFDLSQDVQAGATQTYRAIRNAITAVEALQLGGAA